MKIRLTKEEVLKAWEEAEVVKLAPWRWGTRQTIVFPRDGKHYMLVVESHSEEGLQLYDDMEAVEVRPEERTVIEWVPVGHG